jgi:hypothetical protein
MTSRIKTHLAGPGTVVAFLQFKAETTFKILVAENGSSSSCMFITHDHTIRAGLKLLSITSNINGSNSPISHPTFLGSRDLTTTL